MSEPSEPSEPTEPTEPSERDPIERRVVHRASGGGLVAGSDALVCEAPLELRVGGESVYVTMRTPGHDVELIVGLLTAEAVIEPDEHALVRQVDDAGLQASERGNIVELRMDPARFASRWPDRSLYASSACGVCGATAIDALAEHAEPVRRDPVLDVSLIASLPDVLRRSQPMFEETGAVHAAGLFEASGKLLCAREDVGRHNAVDKVVGWAVMHGELGRADILVVSGRVSFEIAHKAVAASVPIIVAVSAPSSLAIDVAERFRVTVCGFARGGEFNVYSHPARVAPRA